VCCHLFVVGGFNYHCLKSNQKRRNKPIAEVNNVVENIQFSLPRVLSPFRGGGIGCLNDRDSYAGWSFYTPVRATQANQVEG